MLGQDIMGLHSGSALIPQMHRQAGCRLKVRSKRPAQFCTGSFAAIHILRQPHNDLPHIRFHELRHSCASLLIDMGFTLKDVQEWMGHSDIKMTANIYAHLDTARKNTIADSLAGKFGIA